MTPANPAVRYVYEDKLSPCSGKRQRLLRYWRRLYRPAISQYYDMEFIGSEATFNQKDL